LSQNCPKEFDRPASIVTLARAPPTPGSTNGGAGRHALPQASEGVAGRAGARGRPDGL